MAKVFTCQNGNRVEAGNGKRYAFGLGTQKEVVEVSYGVGHETEELIVKFANGKTDWARNFPREWEFVEVDRFDTEIPIVLDTPEYVRSRVAYVEHRATETRELLAGLVDHLFSLSRVSLDEDDRDLINRWVRDGEGDASVVVDILTDANAKCVA